VETINENFVSPSTASSDGQAVHIEEMIAALRRHGHEVRVVSPGNGDHPGWAARSGGPLAQIRFAQIRL
jgi:hypothetical protein